MLPYLCCLSYSKCLLHSSLVFCFPLTNFCSNYFIFNKLAEIILISMVKAVWPNQILEVHTLSKVPRIRLVPLLVLITFISELMFVALTFDFLITLVSKINSYLNRALDSNNQQKVVEAFVFPITSYFWAWLSCFWPWNNVLVVSILLKAILTLTAIRLPTVGHHCVTDVNKALITLIYLLNDQKKWTKWCQLMRYSSTFCESCKTKRRQDINCRKSKVQRLKEEPLL